MSEIRDAAIAVNDRKAAAGLGLALEGHGGPAREFPSITAAYGLDVADAGAVGMSIAAQTMVYQAQAGTDLLATLAGLWIDGLMCGLELARQRAGAGS